MDNSLFTTQILSLLLKKIIIPDDFQGQVEVVEKMLGDDVSGLVDSLTDFAVDTACVDFNVETENEKFTEILKKWLNSINSSYRGKIPSGLRPLAKEYFKERWKYSSFPVLKISQWGEINGVTVPTKLFFVDGKSIHAEDIDTKSKEVKLINYDYYLGDAKDKKNKLDKNVIFAKTNGRWFDKYPRPYLIKRGVYHNWKIIESLKDKQTTILDQIIPYMLLVKKGTEGLADSGAKIYTQPELKAVIKQFQDLMNNIKASSLGEGKIGIPIRATNFDEEISHIIPDLKTIFDQALFVQAERNILAGLGFIDVVQGISSSRRESVLNPKVFIEEVRDGVEDFKQVMKELILLVIEKNKNHRKWMNKEFYITASPVKGFMTDDFKSLIRQLYDRGRISSQTAVELIAEVDFKTEVYRREKEALKGIDETMYPPVRENREGLGVDLPSDFDEEEILDDKTDKIEKENYDIGKYEAPVKCSKCGNIFDMLAETETGMGWVECPKCGSSVTQKDLIDSKQKFACECLKCHKKIKTSKHCNTIKCPKCGGKMRRADRPGRGRPDLSPNAEGDLETAPYKKIADLPASIRKNLSPGLQRTFMNVFNRALQQYKDETRAFKVAWSVIKKIAKKDKGGKWVRKSRLTRAVLELAMEEIETEIINKTFDSKK